MHLRRQPLLHQWGRPQRETRPDTCPHNFTLPWRCDVSASTIFNALACSCIHARTVIFHHNPNYCRYNRGCSRRCIHCGGGVCVEEAGLESEANRNVPSAARVQRQRAKHRKLNDAQPSKKGVHREQHGDGKHRISPVQWRRRL